MPYGVHFSIVVFIVQAVVKVNTMPYVPLGWRHPDPRRWFHTLAPTLAGTLRFS
jgi:hypothetical protein